MSLRKKCLYVVIWLCCLSHSVLAVDVSGSQDLSAVSSQINAKIIDYRYVKEKKRIYPMGAIRKISGQLRYEGQTVARGQIIAITYELPAEHTASAAFTATRKALQTSGAQLLFWCQARDCGESSLWANQVFSNVKLIGADDQQEYLLIRLAAPQDNSLVVLYGITRVNHRAYLHVEQLDACTPLEDLLPTSATLMRELKSTGDLYFPVLAEPVATWLTLISRSLNFDATMRISLVGLTSEAWRQGLIDRGVCASRLHTDSSDIKGLRLHLIR
ncbi:DUF4892 domain-containing protein [Candidatus Pseudomonas adelgestsugas]|uniref:DUF4892 domain-containing protein n=1 Tax=Candidatus Pseudomonas adelgestsugas TaxID=1302376 RepID=A0ABX5R9E1_9PSED|nr:DUF4892 domain-containing protein [Candidatus Pseudomonas adelgestsugas]QAX81974.1 hypothetical protein C3B55_00649 [Candidatus Pseudomonas adelgestsugas]